VAITMILAQADDGLNLPDGTGETLVFVLFLAAIGGLWFLLQRSRKRAEHEFWERKQREREERDERLS
jgi:hypothetical protein